MPIYEYRCTRCGSEFEDLTLSGGGAPQVACPSCRSKRVSRLLSAFAVQSSAGQAPIAGEGPCGACGAARRGMCSE